MNELEKMKHDFKKHIDTLTVPDTGGTAAGTQSKARWLKQTIKDIQDLYATMIRSSQLDDKSKAEFKLFAVKMTEEFIPKYR